MLALRNNPPPTPASFGLTRLEYFFKDLFIKKKDQNQLARVQQKQDRKVKDMEEQALLEKKWFQAEINRLNEKLRPLSLEPENNFILSKNGTQSTLHLGSFRQRQLKHSLQKISFREVPSSNLMEAQVEFVQEQRQQLKKLQEKYENVKNSHQESSRQRKQEVMSKTRLIKSPLNADETKNESMKKSSVQSIVATPMASHSFAKVVDSRQEKRIYKRPSYQKEPCSLKLQEYEQRQFENRSTPPTPAQARLYPQSVAPLLQPSGSKQKTAFSALRVISNQSQNQTVPPESHQQITQKEKFIFQDPQSAKSSNRRHELYSQASRSKNDSLSNKSFHERVSEAHSFKKRKSFQMAKVQKQSVASSKGEWESQSNSKISQRSDE